MGLFFRGRKIYLMITSSSHGMRSTSIGLIMKMRYVRSFIIISMKIDSIMRMGMCMLNH